jgi:hypothetical protein
MTSLEYLNRELLAQDKASFRVKAQLIKQGESLDLPPETWRNVKEQAS